MKSPDPYEDYRWTEGSSQNAASQAQERPERASEGLRPAKEPLEPDPLAEGEDRSFQQETGWAPGDLGGSGRDDTERTEDRRRAEGFSGGSTRPESLRETQRPPSDWPMVAHLSTFAGLAVPFGNVLAPLAIWLMMREDHPETEFHAREALNFQISMWIWGVIGVLLIFTIIGLPVALFGFLFGGTFSLIATIIAAVKARHGERFEYPLSFRLIGPPQERQGAASFSV